MMGPSTMILGDLPCALGSRGQPLPRSSRPFPCSARPLRADIIFCNNFVSVVNVAIAYPQDDGTFISRGWLSLSAGNCVPFDTTLHVKVFYFRGESARYRDESGRFSRYFWGKG